MDSFKEKFGARVQEIRKAKKLTQEKLAEMIELDIPNISNVERGKRFVSSSTLEKIITALDVTPDELFKFSHFDSREILIKRINKILEQSTDKEIEYFYRQMSVYSEYLSKK